MSGNEFSYKVFFSWHIGGKNATRARNKCRKTVQKPSDSGKFEWFPLLPESSQLFSDFKQHRAVIISFGLGEKIFKLFTVQARVHVFLKQHERTKVFFKAIPPK